MLLQISKSFSKMSEGGKIFKDISAEEEDQQQPTEIESLCFSCGKNVFTFILPHRCI
jgi:hypothetical protein